MTTCRQLLQVSSSTNGVKGRITLHREKVMFGMGLTKALHLLDTGIVSRLALLGCSELGGRHC